MTIFICDTKDCPNLGAVYDFGDEHPQSAECGGCRIKLEPVKEN